MIVTAAVGLAAAIAAGGRRRMAAGGLAAGLLVVPPLLLMPAGAVAGVGWAVRRVRKPSGEDADLLLLGDLMVLGLRAGLTLEGALQKAVFDLPPGLAGEVRSVLRAARRSGIGPALQEAEGRASRLYRAAAHAVQTGAPLAGAVEALTRELRHAEHARQMAAARRLPVRLLLPLALLILPGFVLVVVGPALLGSLARLEIGW